METIDTNSSTQAKVPRHRSMQSTTSEEHEQQYSDYNGTRDNIPSPQYERLAKDGSRGNDAIGGSSMPMVEIGFNDKEVPTWTNQITLRSLIVSVGLGTFFSILSIKESLSTGVVSSVNIYAPVVGYSFIKGWLMILETSGIVGQPFTRQENAMIQSCVVAITGITVSGGLGNYIFAMSSIIASRYPEGNDPQNIKDPGTAWIIAFLFVTSFSGFFFMIPLRRYMILNLKLLYPSADSVGNLLNTIHSPLNSKFASFYFEFYTVHVGVGMLCPYSTTFSLLVGSILSWGILFPFLRSKRGIWYDSVVDARFDYRGFGGYRFTLGLAIILGDSTFHILKYIVANLICKSRNKGTTAVISGSTDNHHHPHHLPVNISGPRCSDPDHESNDIDSTNCCTDTMIRTQNFLNEFIPTKVAIVGVVALVAVSAISLPIIFPPVKWYYVLCMYAVASPVAFSRAHVAGLTDMNPTASFGRLAMFIFGAWAGVSHGGVLVALVACGVLMSFISPASQLMSELKTGYLTLASSRSILVTKVFGNMIGCIVTPLIFKYYQSHYSGFGGPRSTFSVFMAPYFREGAITGGLEGLKGLPMYAVHFGVAFFIAAIVINIIKELLPEKVAKYVPIPIAMGVPFHIGGYISISFCIGSLIAFLWRKKNKAKADAYSPMVATALICGDGFWILLDSILTLVNFQPPACASFLPAGQS
ncbi:probable metal-nicotianamine transporter YSL14 [Juglans microcarpa x Juglans regia]|uniref:probable metal-nicotianamine transporter YSL14 n=1 Tax=Juglans microcarpa x Juglans regia TaxID=2249226 RepID=UPI001B7EFD0E|nr:probable metal-nicotianamine transporter YSL14 [Juglans microcarpa x Juglans regia]